jgi:hypothetical protein
MGLGCVLYECRLQQVRAKADDIAQQLADVKRSVKEIGDVTVP